MEISAVHIQPMKPSPPPEPIPPPGGNIEHRQPPPEPPPPGPPPAASGEGSQNAVEGPASATAKTTQAGQPLQPGQVDLYA